MESLSPGTIVEFEFFATLVVGENLLLVFESQSGYIHEGSLMRLMRLKARSDNDWIVTLEYDDGWTHDDVWIKRDWNGNVKTQIVDYDYGWNEWYDDYEGFDAYEDYDPDDY